MNTVLSTHLDEQHNQHPPSLVVQHSTKRSVGLADRLALHLGIALITWSRRRRTVTDEPSRDHVQARRRIALERAEREREWQLANHYCGIRR